MLFRSYFELKARFNQVLDDQKRQVTLIEETIAMTKNGYSDSLKELEKISEEIHQRRAARKKRCEKSLEKLGIREDGVGAENPPPAATVEKGTYRCGNLDVTKPSVENDGNPSTVSKKQQVKNIY